MTLQESFRYGHPFGEECLREQIAAYLLQSRGLKAEPSAIIIGSSTQQMLIYLGQILKEEFPSIIVENPGYDGAKEAFQFHRFMLETLPVYETGTDFSKLEQMISRLIYVTPSHQSPIGVSMSIQERHMLIHWANNIQGYIIEDDYDSEFRYTQQPFPALASIDSTRVIYLGNFSKSFLPGIRLNYMVLPQPLLNQYKNNFFTLRALLPFLASLQWLNLWKKENGTVILNECVLFISENAVHRFRVKKTVSAKYIDYRGAIRIVHTRQDPSKPFRRMADRARLPSWSESISYLHLFHKNHFDEPAIKLGFSNLTCEEIQLGVELLKKRGLNK